MQSQIVIKTMCVRSTGTYTRTWSLRKVFEYYEKKKKRQLYSSLFQKKKFSPAQRAPHAVDGLTTATTSRDDYFDDVLHTNTKTKKKNYSKCTK